VVEVKNQPLVRSTGFSSSRPSAGKASERSTCLTSCCSVMPGPGPSRLFARALPVSSRARDREPRARAVAFDQERLAIVKDRLGDMLRSTIMR
jgi:hypothetical protein